jgi:hypothetical protein
LEPGSDAVQPTGRLCCSLGNTLHVLISFFLEPGLPPQSLEEAFKSSFSVHDRLFSVFTEKAV